MSNLKSKKIGILFSYTASGELLVTYDQIKELAKQAGLDEKYVPTATSEMDAWKRSTSLTANGKKLEPSTKFINKMKRKYGDKITVKMAVKTITVCNRVGENAPKLIKHLEREVIISQAGLTDRVNRQTIGEMTFDPDNRIAEFMAYPDLTYAINGSGQAILDEIHTKFNNARLYADNQHIRQGVRNFLWDVYSVSLRGTGGLYNIPLPQDTNEANKVKNQVLALIKYLDGLDKFRTASGEVSGLAYEIEDDPNETFGTATKVKLQAENTLKQITIELEKTLKEVNNSTGKRGLKASLKKAQERIMYLTQMANTYKESLAADVSSISTSIKIMQGVIDSKMMDLL